MARTIKVKSASDIADKWAEVTPGRAGYYESEASVAGGLWEANAAAAEKTYKAAISQANIEKRFSGGVKRAGGAKYERKVKDVGVGRFGPGVEAAKSDMESGVAPFRDVLDGLSIPDRGPRGSTTNYAIVQKVGDPLHKKRLSILGATAGS